MTNQFSLLSTLQYVFMFQWPKLPELALSLGDYKALEDSFKAPPMVRLKCVREKVLSLDMF